MDEISQQKYIFFYNNSYFLQKDWQVKENVDIPFNYMIGADGRTYEARGWSIESEHSSIRADRVISVVLIGNLLRQSIHQK